MTQPEIKVLTTPADLAEIANTMARDFKEYGVQQIDPGFDIPCHVLGFRDGFMLAEIITHEVNRDQGLFAVAMLCAMQCDAVALTTDAHVTSAENNPKTGQRWAPGEMQGLCDDENACDTGLLTDCLATTAMFTDLRLAFYNWPYHVHKSARSVAWHEKPEVIETYRDDAEPAVVKGIVPDSMRHAMTAVRAQGYMFGSPLNPLGAGVDDPAARRDAGSLRALAEARAMLRIARPSDPVKLAIYQSVIDDNPERITWLNEG